MILLVNDNEGYIKVALSEKVIAAEIIPARTYVQDGKYLLVRAEQHVQYNDVLELQSLGYRVATPSEQEEYVASKKKKKTIRETQKESE